MCRKKGFTLVELLIVIVVIGVLSAMMMLSSTEAVSSAKAANIVNNLRNWKTAALEWYADNIDKVKSNGKVIGKDGAEGNLADKYGTQDMVQYMGGGFTPVSIAYAANSVKDSSGYVYFICHTSNSTKWLVGCQMPNDDYDLRKKLESRASSTGLLYFKDNKTGSYTADAMKGQGSGINLRVWMEVIDFSKQ